MREFLPNPILGDHGGNLCLQEGPDPPQQGLVFLADGRANSIEIAIGLRKHLLCRNTHGRFLLIGCPLPRTCESEQWRKASRMLLPPCFNNVRRTRINALVADLPWLSIKSRLLSGAAPIRFAH